MRQLRPDLWETRADSPFPGLTTHAYLWTGGPSGNVLFYSTLTDADFAEIEIPYGRYLYVLPVSRKSVDYAGYTLRRPAGR